MSEELELLRQINTRLGALLAVVLDDYLRSTPDAAKPRARSIDRLLSDVGMTDVEIAAVLGKSRQAVGQMLAKDRKSRAAPARKGKN